VVTGKDNSEAELAKSQSVCKLSIPQQVACFSVRPLWENWAVIDEDGACFRPPVLFKRTVSYMFSECPLDYTRK
jgi:hypothetical protein